MICCNIIIKSPSKIFLHICVLQNIDANLIRSSSQYFLHVSCKLMQLSSNLQAILFSMCFVNWCKSHQIFKKQKNSPYVVWKRVMEHKCHQNLSPKFCPFFFLGGVACVC
jgi:hypothetical protein